MARTIVDDHFVFILILKKSNLSKNSCIFLLKSKENLFRTHPIYFQDLIMTSECLMHDFSTTLDKNLAFLLHDFSMSTLVFCMNLA